MRRMQNIKLNRLVTHFADRQHLILKHAAARSKTVNTGDLHHVSAFFVLHGHSVHRKISRMSDLDHRVVAGVSVERAAEQSDIPIQITCCALVHAVLRSDANHIAAVFANNRN